MVIDGTTIPVARPADVAAFAAVLASAATARQATVISGGGSKIIEVAV